MLLKIFASIFIGVLACSSLPFFLRHHSVTQPEVQWCNHSSLKSLPPRLKSSAHLSLPGRCNHRHVPPHWLVFEFLVETGFQHVDQAGLKLLTSGDLPTLASQNAGITGVSHHVWPLCNRICYSLISFLLFIVCLLHRTINFTGVFFLFVYWTFIESKQSLKHRKYSMNIYLVDEFNNFCILFPLELEFLMNFLHIKDM